MRHTRRYIYDSKELARKLFVSLIKLGDNPWEGYTILNDGNFVKRIYAESDKDAIKQFNEYLDSKKSKRDSEKSGFDYISYLKKYINNLTNSKKRLQNQIDEINDKIAELKATLEEKEGYASLEEREIDY